MNIFLAAVSLSIFLLGFVYSNKELFKDGVVQDTSPTNIVEEVLSDEDIKEEKTPVVLPTLIPSVRPYPTTKLILDPTQAVISGVEISNFIYPNSVVSENTQSHLRLTSIDDPKIISNWYKEKLTALSFSAISSSFSQANDVYNASLSADNGEIKISIKITKNNASLADISVSILQ